MPIGKPGGSGGASGGGGATARVEQIACDDIAAIGTATHINPQAGGGAVSVVYGEGDAELVTAVTDAANNGLVTLAAGLHYIEVTGRFQGSAASVGAEVRLKQWRDGQDEANDPVLAVETVSLPVSATDHSDSVPLSVWLAAPTQVYFELEELGSTATVEVDDPKITVIRWGGASGRKGDKGDAGDDAADYTRAERIAFQEVTSPGNVNEMEPLATSPISVVSGSGDAEILTAVDDIEITVAAGLYLVKFEGVLDASSNNTNPLASILRVSDSATLAHSTKPAIRSGDDQEFSAFAILALSVETDISIHLNFPDTNATNVDSFSATFLRWGGGEGRGGAAFSIHDIVDELVDYVAAGGPTGALAASDFFAASDESAAGDPNKKITAENLFRELVRIGGNLTPVNHLALDDRVPFADKNFTWRGGMVEARQFRDMVFENPPSGLSDAQKTAVRTAVGAGTAIDKVATTDADTIDQTDTAISTSLVGRTTLDDAKYLSLRMLMRVLQRVLKTASTTLMGVVLLARNSDIDSETSTTRVPTVAGVFRAIARKVKAASTTVAGIVELATVGELNTGTDIHRAVTPAGLRGQIGTVVSADEKTAGSETTVRRFSPKDIHDMIDTHAPSGGADIAVDDESSDITAALRSLNFVGAGVTAADDGSGNVTVTIAGGGAPVPGSHNRYIGWAAAAAPTQDELDALSVETDDSLGVPSVANPSDGETRHLVIGQVADQADLTSIRLSNGGDQNWLTSFTKAGATATIDGATVEYWVSNNGLLLSVYADSENPVTATIAR